MAIGAKESVQECTVKFVDEFEQHVSIKELLSDGFQTVNF